MNTANTQITPLAVWNIIQVIPAYSRDTWTKVRMVIKSELGGRAVGWIESDIQNWINQLVEKSQNAEVQN